MTPSQNIAVNAWQQNLMATRFHPNFDKGAETPICRIIFSIIAIFHKGLAQISFSLSSPTLRHYPKFSGSFLRRKKSRQNFNGSSCDAGRAVIFQFSTFLAVIWRNWFRLFVTFSALRGDIPVVRHHRRERRHRRRRRIGRHHAVERIDRREDVRDHLGLIPGQPRSRARPAVRRRRGSWSRSCSAIRPYRCPCRREFSGCSC